MSLLSKLANEMLTQPQEAGLMTKPESLYIGIPKEPSILENRIALTPSSVAVLVQYGHRVVIETGAGDRARFSDFDYSEAGAEISHSKEDVYKSTILIKVAPFNAEEIELMRPNQLVIAPLHLSTQTTELMQRLRQKRVIAVAMEYIKDASGAFPIVRAMSEIAGASAILTAAELMSSAANGQGVLLGGVSGVPSAKVVIIGAGTVAECATRTALGLGADVRIFDNNTYKLMRLQQHLGRAVYTSTLNPRVLEQELLTADVAIGALHSQTGRSPMLVSEDVIMRMKKGAVIIDVSIDQGGIFETSRLTEHDQPVYREHGVIHYCVANIASRVAQTASTAISNIYTPLLLRAADSGGLEHLIIDDLGLRNGVFAYKGSITNQHVGERLNIKTTDLNLIITNRF